MCGPLKTPISIPLVLLVETSGLYLLYFPKQVTYLWQSLALCMLQRYAPFVNMQDQLTEKRVVKSEDIIHCRNY